jgi:hypothetical protein
VCFHVRGVEKHCACGSYVLRVKYTEGLVRETACVKEVKAHFEVLWRGSARD